MLNPSYILNSNIFSPLEGDMGFVPRFYPCLWLLFFLNSHASLLSSTTHLCSDEEAAALMQFKNSFSINRTAARICEFHSVKSYPKTNSWKEGTDCCSWDGITCDKNTGHVIGLDLSCSWLRGPFFSNSSLFLLSHLQRLNLAANFFQRSRIPSEFGRFANLSHLNLSRSWFSGSVPNEISHLTELVSLDLSSDDASIPFPLRTLELDDPTVEGIVHNLTKVRELILYGINMSSVNPSCLMNLSSSLTSLNLFGCSIRGNFPNNIFSLPNLKSLNLKRNPDLVGYLPKFNWSGPLENLILPITSFSGQLPDSIGDLLSLRHLDLAFCKFSGSIPSSLGKLSLLTYLDLSYNSFSGQIPSSLASLTRLEVLDASENQLVGSIPSQVTAFPSLIDLDLSANLLNGTIPSWVYSLPSLQYLNLRYNQLMTHINEFQHNSLREISLENNKLQGPIPSSISELVNLTRLDMSSNNLSGLVQLDMFLKLQNLRFLSLSDNSLSLSSNIRANFTLPNLKELYFSSCNISEFPIFLEGSNNLSRLDLSNNRIRGGIPKWMLHMGNDYLEYLNLSHNLLTNLEQLPWKTFQFLDLRSNLIRGALPIPQSMNFFVASNNSFSGEISSRICNISYLEVLDLSHNNFSGTIPQCFGNLSKSLGVLNLRMNRLYGSIPPRFAEGCELRNLNLNGNQLEGPLPQSLSQCKNLEVLDLGNNKIDDTYPAWLEMLPKLQVLVLRSNKLHGFITDFGVEHSFSSLRIFDISNNDFTGTLPVRLFQTMKAMMNASEGASSFQYMKEEFNPYEYSMTVTMKSLVIVMKISTIFTSIDLSLNEFQGDIPGVIGELHSLKGLNLSHNRFDGLIPPSMGNLRNLEWLDLSSNNLIGDIPQELTSLTFLSVLNVSHNHLTGRIPLGKQFNTFSNGSFEGNLRLCGFPLSKTCNNNNETQPPSSTLPEEDHSGAEKGFISWKVVFMGYGCGIIFGVSMGYIVFTTGKPKWFVKLVEGDQKKKSERLKKKAPGRSGR